MNDILRFLNSHASVRRFTDAPISDEMERTIVSTAQRSPTSANLQAYSIIGVRDPDTKQTLAALCGNQAHVAQAALFHVFCADLYRLSLLNKARGYRFNGDYAEMFVIASVDTSLVACRALLAAQALGLGGVMVGGIRNNSEDVCRLLDLPEFTYPVMGMSLGYPSSPPRIKPRLPVDAIYFRERYHSGGFEQLIAEYDKAIEQIGYLRGREVEPDRYPGFSGQYSWSEHSARRMASTASNTLRSHLLPFLQQRGFLHR